MIKVILIVINILLFLIVDLIYYKMHIKRLKYFINGSPVECVIEDLIVVSYGYTEQFGYKTKDYRIYPVVKMGNDFYFTYGDYSICHYQQGYTLSNHTFTNVGIFRKDHSEVKIGDKAYLYIKKKIDISVSIDIDKNMYKLNKQQEYFNNVNKNYDIRIMKNLNFFEGLIDIEKMN